MSLLFVGTTWTPLNDRQGPQRRRKVAAGFPLNIVIILCIAQALTYHSSHRNAQTQCCLQWHVANRYIKAMQGAREVSMFTLEFTRQATQTRSSSELIITHYVATRREQMNKTRSEL